MNKFKLKQMKAFRVDVDKDFYVLVTHKERNFYDFNLFSEMYGNSLYMFGVGFIHA